MPNRMQITHKQASDLLLDLVKTINTNNPVYIAGITISAPAADEDANIIEYTLILESKTHLVSRTGIEKVKLSRGTIYDTVP